MLKRLTSLWAARVLVIAFAGYAFLQLSSAEPQETAPLSLAGVWSTANLDTLENPAWDIVGLFSCRCTAETYDYLESLLKKSP